MKRFQNILAYLPANNHGDRVISWCSTIAKAASARNVTLMTSIEDHLPEYPPVEACESTLKNERIQLASLAQKITGSTETQLIVDTGSALKNILNELAEGTYDLVILPVDDIASRIFAERLARKSPVGVLTLPADCSPKFQSILTTIDFSDLSKMSLDWAEAFASLTSGGAKLEALHIVKMPEDSRATLAVTPERLRHAIHTTSRQNLASFIKTEAATPEHWKQSIAEHFLAAFEITRLAKANDVDLVVIGSHGRNALSVALLGGQTAEVIRTCKQPVLIVKKKNESLVFLRQLIGLSK